MLFGDKNMQFLFYALHIIKLAFASTLQFVLLACFADEDEQSSSE